MNDHQVPDKKKYELSGQTVIGNLDYGLAGALCYAPIPPINLAACLVVLFTEPESNKFLRFHAIQGLMLFGVLIVASIATNVINMFAAIPVIGGLFGLIGWLVWIALAGGWLLGSIMLALKAKEREMYKLPYVGDIAESKA